ncbi:hypothetical protein CEUSTIGMA_g7244.t1 [Chlamydomonas eustigma]|uniref:Uncharacterized protein n=1 Tax=Chlamydomonas eustigma TaxID=1157962 RepID=A0A250X9Q6_9CHLO|nr:hypothetical protein CEUSTIGMA_g7244.t1 [Chlamydomonas eustigma]|eukprot:GAX79804.1 hypothetical protein CEUSTIGMA_g7244.t1 [Chlamydomonas eustigma]
MAITSILECLDNIARRASIPKSKLSVVEDESTPFRRSLVLQDVYVPNLTASFIAKEHGQYSVRCRMALTDIDLTCMATIIEVHISRLPILGYNPRADQSNIRQAPAVTTTYWFRKPASWFKQLQILHGNGVWFEAELATVQLEAVTDTDYLDSTRSSEVLQQRECEPNAVWVESGYTSGGRMWEAGIEATGSKDLSSRRLGVTFNKWSPNKPPPAHEVVDRSSKSCVSEADTVTYTINSRHMRHHPICEPSTWSASTWTWLNKGQEATRHQDKWHGTQFAVDVTMINLDVSPYTVINLDYLHLVPVRPHVLGL